MDTTHKLVTATVLFLTIPTAFATPAGAAAAQFGATALPVPTANGSAALEALSDAMTNELSPTDASGDTSLGFNGYLSAADDYWFRYSDLGHNRLNLQLTLGSTAQIGQSVALYSRFSTDYANSLGNSPAYSDVGSGTKTVTTSGGSSTTPFSSSSYGWGTLASDAKVLGDFPLTAMALGLRVNICNVAVAEVGVADYVSPLAGAQYTFSASPPSGAPAGSTAQATVTGIGLYNTVEGYGQISVNDTWMKCLAMHPYLYAGFDYNFKYLGNTTPSTSNTGEYLEVGLRPSYRLPGIPFLKINPYASSSFIFGQQRQETNGTTSSGYLGSTAGLSLNFSLTRAFNIPHQNGDFSLGVYGEEVMASNRFVDTLYGSTVHSDSTVAGVYLAFGLR
ncbi:MAG: hypothetical protein ACP5QA_09405 [Phycisphaerae bacterium]